MSVLIKGMELPKSCYDCPLCYDMMECRMLGLRFFDKEARERFDFCTERHHDCPLVYVPPYGRLIDAFDTVKTLCDKGLYMHAEIVSDMPTIICGEKVKT